LKEDFYLLANGQEIPCISVEYEDDHNMLDAMKVVLAFRKINKSDKVIIRYEDNLFGQGVLNFKFDSENITNIPDLKI